MSKLVNLITALSALAYLPCLSLVCHIPFQRVRGLYGRFAVHDHCHFCFGFGAL